MNKKTYVNDFVAGKISGEAGAPTAITRSCQCDSPHGCAKIGTPNADDIYVCIEKDRARLSEALGPSNTLRIRGKWRKDKGDAWINDILLCLTGDPFTRFSCN